MQNDLNVLTISGTVNVNHNISGSVGVGGSGGNDDAILSGVWSKTSYTNSSITKLSPAFPNGNITLQNVTEVGNHACEYSVGGKNWNLPECLTVGMYAFRSNKTIISVNLPKCTEISLSAFEGCTNLATVNVPKLVTIGDTAFSGTGVQEFNLPECVTVGDSAFRNSTALQSINLPKCESIAGSAFLSCNNLTAINLPCIKTIGNLAFNSDTRLATVTIGDACTNINGNVFFGCTSLTSFTCYATTPPALGTGVFTNTPIQTADGKIYVPSASVDTYKAASGWSTWSSKIEAIPS